MLRYCFYDGWLYARAIWDLVWVPFLEVFLRNPNWYLHKEIQSSKETIENSNWLGQYKPLGLNSAPLIYQLWEQNLSVTSEAWKEVNARIQVLQERLFFLWWRHWRYYWNNFVTIISNKINRICTYSFSHAIGLDVYYFINEKMDVLHLFFLCQHLNY